MTCKSIIVKMRRITAANFGVFGGYLFLAMILYKRLHQESTLKYNVIYTTLFIFKVNPFNYASCNLLGANFRISTDFNHFLINIITCIYLESLKSCWAQKIINGVYRFYVQTMELVRIRLS